MRASVFDWVFQHVPDSNNEDVRRRVVYVILALNLAMLIALIGSTLYVVSVHRYQLSLCREQNAGRALANHRTAVIRDYLDAHGAHEIAVELLPSPRIDCSSGHARP